ncbi:MULTISPECIES: HEPN domain-containing protein [unclassified Sphingobium]|uniref:HEPN domain-containing protein n=1 Tax=unclassified Sphingobium TaxID=2611147 RepID=UPI000C9F70A9|nr:MULTISPECIES: HEPN domain-containing protein [unclassified Sphingobium]MCB4859831.1 HEPN domain-containing protein [Sphingobium sp. PNB]PNQ03168.1 DNA-binding protein [Sphingobium sp. SA916]
MMPSTDREHLPWPVRQELCRVTAMLFETFAENLKGRLSEHYRSGRILTLILHGSHARSDSWNVAPEDAFHLLAIVNHPRLARTRRDWRLARDRLRRAWEFGEISRPVRLTVHSLEQFNSALAKGIPHFVAIAGEGIPLYEMEGFRLLSPRLLPMQERHARGQSEFARWHDRASDFLLGAAFYRSEGNAPMAALLLHQACEHLYQCVLWTITLHGPRTHALDELRERAEALDARLSIAWPRATPFERRAFGCIRRAYVEVRYGRSYRISPDELAWAMERVTQLHGLLERLCRERLDGMVAIYGEACHGRRA